LIDTRRYQSAGADTLMIRFRIQIRVDTTRYEVKAPDTLAKTRDTRIPDTHTNKTRYAYAIAFF